MTAVDIIVWIWKIIVVIAVVLFFIGSATQNIVIGNIVTILFVIILSSVIIGAIYTLIRTWRK